MDSRHSSASSFKSEAKSSRQSLGVESQSSHGYTTSAVDTPSTKEETAVRASPTFDIPNGGLTAWLQVLSGFMCFVNSWGLVNAFGVFQEYYSSTLIPNISDSDISWIGSIQAFLLCAATVFAGPVYDQGHPRILIISGSFLVVFGMMMTSLCSTYWQLMLAQGICVGIGSGGFFLPAIAIVPSYFTTKKAFAMGIAASGSSFGGIIYPIIFHRVQPHVGFGWATRVFGFIAMVSLIVPCVCIKARAFPPSKRKLVDFSAFKELPFTLFCIASFVGFVGLYIPFFYVTEFSNSQAMLNSTISFYMLPITSAGSAAGRILPGLLADRLGCLNVLGSLTVIAGMLGFCWMAIHHSLGGMVIWSLLYGAFSGSFVSLQPSTVVSITSDLSTVGGRMGLNTFCAALGILIGTPIAGILVGNDNWVGMQALCGGTLIVASALIVATRFAQTGLELRREA